MYLTIQKKKPEFDINNIPAPHKIKAKLDDYINSNAELRKLSYRTLFHKSYFEIIESDFPYQELTLQELGIPLYDVIEVPTDKGLFYVELSGDAQLYA